MTFSGYSGTYGNFIKIDHGGGISTGYAHIRDGGRFVGVGEWVDAGPEHRVERHDRCLHRMPPALRGLQRRQPHRPACRSWPIGGSALADHRTRPVSRVKPATVFSTVAVGAVTASVVAAGGPAMAEPDYPSWSEIEQAKQNEQTKQAEIARVGELLVGPAAGSGCRGAGVA